MSKSRVPLIIGLTVAGAGGYYLYSAGGDPKLAGKKIERDVSGSGKSAQKQGEIWAHSAGATLDNTVAEARAKLNETDSKIIAKVSEAEDKLKHLKDEGKSQFDHAKKETARELQETADKFDKLVEKKTSEAKSGISSWFGFGK